jgi:hypothetical protein
MSIFFVKKMSIFAGASSPPADVTGGAGQAANQPNRIVLRFFAT